MSIDDCWEGEIHGFFSISFVFWHVFYRFKYYTKLITGTKSSIASSDQLSYVPCLMFVTNRNVTSWPELEYIL